jgi:hypothetical protein
MFSLLIWQMAVCSVYGLLTSMLAVAAAVQHTVHCCYMFDTNCVIMHVLLSLRTVSLTYW